MSADSYDLVIFDLDPVDSSAPAALASIVKDFPGLPLVLFPPENNLTHPLVSGLENAVCVKKPFYLPDLLAVLNAHIARPKAPLSQKAVFPNNGNPVDGSVDQQAMERCLSQFLQETPALAGMLLYEDQVLAFSGCLDPLAAAEAAEILARSWDKDWHGDLVGYLRLQTSGEELLFYTTVLSGRFLLALGFAPYTSLRLARATSRRGQKVVSDCPTLVFKMQTAPNHPIDPNRHTDEGLIQKVEYEDPERTSDDLRLIELLNNTSAPDPLKADVFFNEWVQEKEFMPNGEGFRYPWEEDQPAIASIPLEPKVDQSDTPPVSHKDLPSSGEGGDAKPGQMYTCVLLPCNPGHLLTGELQVELKEWIPLFCNTFGWQLDDLQIQPNCLQWSIRVDPGVSQSYMVRLLREQSTQHLAEKFPQTSPYSGENDFWAPGYLIISGRQPPAVEYIEGFIRQTRRRQGFAVG